MGSRLIISSTRSCRRQLIFSRTRMSLVFCRMPFLRQANPWVNDSNVADTPSKLNVQDHVHPFQIQADFGSVMT